MMQMTNVASDNSGARVALKWRLFYLSVLVVFVVYGDCQDTNCCVTTVTCVIQGMMRLACSIDYYDKRD
jgi:hypothetical protein